MRSMNPLCAPPSVVRPIIAAYHANLCNGALAATPNSRVERGPVSYVEGDCARAATVLLYVPRISHRLPMCRYRVRVPMIARTRHKSCLSRRLSFNGRALYAAEQGDVFLRPLQFSAPRRLEIAQRAAA